MNNIVKNNTGSQGVFRGIPLEVDETYLVPVSVVRSWGSDVNIASLVLSGWLAVTNDGVNYLDPISGLRSLQESLIETKIVASPAFADKKIGSKKLFSRITGKKFPVVVGLNILDFAIPKAEMKMNGVEITNGEVGETVNFKVLDTPTGTLSGVPNYPLNQFAFDVNLPDGFYSQKSDYDADVIKDLVIRIEINAVEARDLAVNYLIHELKT
jgi:hypothetical protein